MTLICYIEGELYDSGTTALAIEMFLLNKFQGRHGGTVTPQQEACEMDSSSLLPLFFGKCLFFQSFIKHWKQLGIQNVSLRVSIADFF